MQDNGHESLHDYVEPKGESLGDLVRANLIYTKTGDDGIVREYRKLGRDEIIKEGAMQSWCNGELKPIMNTDGKTIGDRPSSFSDERDFYNPINEETITLEGEDVKGTYDVNRIYKTNKKIIIFSSLFILSLALFTGLLFFSTPPKSNAEELIETLVNSLELREQQMVIANRIISNQKIIIENHEQMEYAYDQIVRELKKKLTDNNISWED